MGEGCGDLLGGDVGELDTDVWLMASWIISQLWCSLTVAGSELTGSRPVTLPASRQLDVSVPNFCYTVLAQI